MSADLLGVLRLVHSVTGFLVRLSPSQLDGIADGRLSLSVGSAVAAEREVSPPAPSPLAASSAASAPRRSAATQAGTDYPEIALGLRKQGTIAEGLAYLQHLRVGGKPVTKVHLLGIAEQLGLPLQKSLTKDAVTRAILKHVIGNRNQYAELKP